MDTDRRNLILGGTTLATAGSIALSTSSPVMAEPAQAPDTQPPLDFPEHNQFSMLFKLYGIGSEIVTREGSRNDFLVQLQSVRLTSPTVHHFGSVLQAERYLVDQTPKGEPTNIRFEVSGFEPVDDDLFRAKIRILKDVSAGLYEGRYVGFCFCKSDYSQLERSHISDTGDYVGFSDAVPKGEMLVFPYLDMPELRRDIKNDRWSMYRRITKKKEYYGIRIPYKFTVEHKPWVPHPDVGSS